MASGDTMVIGITGVIGSGKSTVCRYLEEKYGFHWIHADEIVHDLYKFGNAGYKKIREYFGENFVGPKCVLRGRLRQFILKTPQKLWILNQLIHPLILHEVNKKIVQLKKVNARSEKPLKICIEAIYFEPKDLGKFIDHLLIVHCPDEAILLRRLKHRKIPEKQLRTLIKFQQKILPKVGTRIKNTQSLQTLLKQVAELQMIQGNVS